ncbi:MAG: GspH/FimT family pseudopilin [Steroidobacteraceae bacterium]
MLKPARVRRHSGGFTLIELMIAVTVAGILVVLAVPALRVVVENTRLRANAESLKYGLDLARQEAVRRNAQVEFAIVDEGWVVRVPTNNDSATPLHAGTGREASDLVRLTISPDDTVPARITFDSFGRALAANPADGSAPITQVDVESANPPDSDAYRPLRVQVLPGGASRLCDPAVDSTDARACL